MIAALVIAAACSGDCRAESLFIAMKLPKKRTAVLHFPKADMRVTETYRFPVKQ